MTPSLVAAVPGDASWHIDAGDACVDAGNHAAAALHFARAASLDPSDFEAHMSLGLAQQELGQYQDAASSLARACACAPSDPDLWHYCGIAHYLGGAFAAAADAHQHGIQALQSSSADAEAVADAMVCRATALQFISVETGLRDAINEYTRALEVCPGHEGAATERAKLVARQYWEEVRALASPASPVVLLPYRTVSLPPDPTAAANEVGSLNPLLSAHCAHMADAASCARLIFEAEALNTWTSARHEDYATRDIEVSTIPALREWVAPRLASTILPTMAQLFGVTLARLAAREVFIVKYSAEPEPEPQPQPQPQTQREEENVGTQVEAASCEATHSSLPLHRDGYELSFNVLLSEPESFEGGGTRLESLGLTVQPERVGDIFMHCGQMKHGGAEVTRGLRYILVGFVEICDPSVRDQIADEDEEAREGEEEEEEEEDSDDIAEETPGNESMEAVRREDYETLRRYWATIQQGGGGAAGPASR